MVLVPAGRRRGRRAKGPMRRTLAAQPGKLRRKLRLRSQQADAFKPAQSFANMLQFKGGKDIKQLQEFTSQLISQIDDKDVTLLVRDK